MFGLVFAAAVFGKTAGRGAFPAFVRSLRRMEVVPRGLVRPAAFAVVGAEALVAVAMAVPAPAPLTVAGFGLAAFGAAIGRSLRRGDHTPCPCFGRSVAPLGAAHVVRNALLVLAAVLGAIATAAGGSADGGRLAVAGAGGLLPALIVIRFDDLLDLFRPPAAAS